jgi:glycosyltransferase involved in cell wall biosynthesis
MGRSILLIGNYPPPYGGVPHHIERLTRYLADQGWECHVLAGGTTGNEKKGSIQIYKPTNLRKIVGLVRQLWRRRATDWRADSQIRKANPRFWLRHLIYADVGSEIMRKHEIKLISAYNLLTYGPVGGYLSNRFQVPLVMNIFGEIHKHSSMNKGERYFANLLETADAVLSCSTHCGQSIRMLGSEKPFETIIYGIDTEHFSPAASSHLGPASTSPDARTVLFVGRLDREMGLDTFVALAQRLMSQDSTLRFVMVGQAGDYAQEALDASALTQGRMSVFPNVPYDALPDFYRSAHCLVVPTRGKRTCSSLAAMEAMATGTPVIAFAIGGVGEIVRHGTTGLLVPPEDIGALEVAVSELLANDELHKRLGAASLEYARAQFDEARTNTTIEERFLSVIEPV